VVTSTWRPPSIEPFPDPVPSQAAAPDIDLDPLTARVTGALAEQPHDDINEIG